MAKIRDSWGSRFAIIMAVAGSAVGLGNFLRFPSVAAANGGGAFMIPYLVSFLLLGIPLMWIEWTLGRFGGGFGHGTAPGIFHNLTAKRRFIKFFGVIGIFGPLVIFMYYTYIESWTLAYSFFSLSGQVARLTESEQMKSFLQGFQGASDNPYFNGLGGAYWFFVITFLVNTLVIYHGIRGGIERFCKWAMPLLFVCATILMVRVLTLKNPVHPDWTLSRGFGFLWNPDFSALKDPKVWLAAAGQVFFTLSVGIGVILTYASYLSKGDDVALSGLSAASTNEIAEVVLGASIIIPAAFIFFGPAEIKVIADQGTFDLGFVTMPLILNRLPMAPFFGFIWFFLLFLAGVTSSVSLAQPSIAFLEDEFDISKKKAVGIFSVAAFVLCQPAVFLLGHGVVDELDFWGCNFCLPVFALIETILFVWVFGMDKAWEEIHKGADLRIPRFYKFIMKYVTPLLLILILSGWIWDGAWKAIIMSEVSPANKPFIVGTRILLLAIFITLVVLVKKAWKRKATTEEVQS